MSTSAPPRTNQWRERARRVDIRAILRDPRKRKFLMVRTIRAMAEHEGRKLSIKEAGAVYDKVQREVAKR